MLFYWISFALGLLRLDFSYYFESAGVSTCVLCFPSSPISLLQICYHSSVPWSDIPSGSCALEQKDVIFSIPASLSAAFWSSDSRILIDVKQMRNYLK